MNKYADQPNDKDDEKEYLEEKVFVAGEGIFKLRHRYIPPLNELND